MAASAELPDALRVGRRALEELGRQVRIVEDWRPCADQITGHWQLLLELTPIGLEPDKGVPASTRWYFLVRSTYPQGSIHVLPAKDGGLELTFAHQFPNTAMRGHVPWRDGSMCVVETTPGHQLAMALNDPRTADERLIWWVGRAIDWLVAASRDELIRHGDPFELPYYGLPAEATGPVIAFNEGPDTFAEWSASQARSGVAELGIVGSPLHPLLAVKSFKTTNGQTVVRPEWGANVAGTTNATDALWLRLNDVPVVWPWRAPETWRELRRIASDQGINLNRILQPVVRRLRDRQLHVALIGFSLPVNRGDRPSLVHWVPAALLEPLGGTFRAGPLADEAAIHWLPSANWHPSQLGTRGRFEKGLLDRSVAILGCGALGSAVAELLVRGGIRTIVVVDGEILQPGNLVRHMLGIPELGSSKAVALADRLNQISPNVTASAIATMFPVVTAEDADRLRAATLIIDTTGNDQVVQAVGAFEWGDELREFAAVSFSYGAKRLYSYVARIGGFEAEEFFDAAMPWIAADKRLTEELVWEGVGCRYPIFPGRADDVTALAALAVRDLDERLLATGPLGLRVFERAPDGTIAELFDPGEPV